MISAQRPFFRKSISILVAAEGVVATVGALLFWFLAEGLGPTGGKSAAGILERVLLAFPFAAVAVCLWIAAVYCWRPSTLAGMGFHGLIDFLGIATVASVVAVNLAAIPFMLLTSETFEETVFSTLSTAYSLVVVAGCALIVATDFRSRRATSGQRCHQH